MPTRVTSHWLAGHSLKSRFYFIIWVLGLLPVLGVVLTLVTIQNARRDHAAATGAAFGTIYLERINGLVYSVVMESRGIYMSADWHAAEPFAKKLMSGLVELKQVAHDWRRTAVTAQRTNVEELSKRIDQFVVFRTELVRLAREENTAAGRAFGDNDGNRNVRTALNESLQALARACEQESARVRSQIEANDHNALFALACLAALGALVLAIGIMLVRGQLLSPLFNMKRSMLRLADGNLEIAVEGTERKDEIGEMARTIGVFHATSLERAKLNREARLLSQLNDWLQSCKSLDELYQMVGKFLGRLLPGCAGSLYIYANSRDVLESAHTWNGGNTPATMHPEDCWGLRRGRAYTFGEEEIDFPCAHVDAEHPGRYCCIPILAHGETIGLLHLEFKSHCDATTQIALAKAIAEQRRMGLVCAEQISLAIANAKLRDQLRDQSIRDTLTGMYNRRYMLDACRRDFSRATRSAECVSLLSLDVDHFKTFNDNHGHDAGDTMLRAVGECLMQSFRDYDVPCRFGGEEFVVILPGATSDVAARRAEDVRAKIETLAVRYIDGALPKVTVSIGVATFPQSGDSPQAVLKAADAALYLAKEAGRNRIQLAASCRRGGSNSASQPETPATHVACLNGAHHVFAPEPLTDVA